MKYALTYREVISILMQRHVMVDGKVRTDKTYPAGFMGACPDLLHHCTRSQCLINSMESLISFLYHADVVSIAKTGENFRLLYDTKGRFRLHSIKDEDAKVYIKLSVTIWFIIVGTFALYSSVQYKNKQLKISLSSEILRLA